jgi:hypothetical protein
VSGDQSDAQDPRQLADFWALRLQAGGSGQSPSPGATIPGAGLEDVLADVLAEQLN